MVPGARSGSLAFQSLERISGWSPSRDATPEFREGNNMGKGRLEAFSDGVIAVIITIMVLEMKVPHGTDLAALVPSIPVFLSYVLSYVYTGIY